jgi:hypothetical protein
MKPVLFRGKVLIDPYKDDLIKKVIEERKKFPKDDPLSYSLKILANSIYGFFIELNVKDLRKKGPVELDVYSGDKVYHPKGTFDTLEIPGPFFAPYIGSLITAGGRLMLGLLDKSVTDLSGIFTCADTDALHISASEFGGSLEHIPGCTGKRLLTWEEVKGIIRKFVDLNPYDKDIVKGSILSLVHELIPGERWLGLSLSAKRYVVYKRDGDNITIVNPKAHGLGYLFPPINSPDGWHDEKTEGYKHEAPKWIYEFWESLLRRILNLKINDPAWLNRPQMMRKTVTSVNVLENLHNWPGFRPYGFFFQVIVNKLGLLCDLDMNEFQAITQFEPDQEKWIDAKCINTADFFDKKEYGISTSFESREQGNFDGVIACTFKELLERVSKIGSASGQVLMFEGD